MSGKTAPPQCIDYWVEVTCPCESHTWAQRNICVCAIRPKRYPVMHECGGPSVWPGGTGSGGGIVPPTIPPTNTLGNGGVNGSTGGINNALCAVKDINDFNLKYKINLLNDYEDIANACKRNCGVSGFEECVRNAIINDRILFLQEKYGLTLTETELLDLVGMECVFSTNFEKCAMEGIVYIDTDDDSDNDLSPNTILPYSCKSFKFQNIGLPGKINAFVKNVKFTFIETTPSFKIYRFNVNFELMVEDFGSLYPAESGLRKVSIF